MQIVATTAPAKTGVVCPRSQTMPAPPMAVPARFPAVCQPDALPFSASGTTDAMIPRTAVELVAAAREALGERADLLIDTGWSPAIVSYQDRSLKRLRSYRAGGVLQEWDYPPDPYAARLALVLQALDGWRAGARHRDIAEALYGFERVALDWADPRESLRDQVRYAISRGRALMDHGYRGFLQ